MQRPATQPSVAAQLTPTQVRSVQTSVTQTCTPEHEVIAQIFARHMPPAHAWVDAHVLPHAPQLPSSAVTSTHAVPHASFGAWQFACGGVLLHATANSTAVRRGSRSDMRPPVHESMPAVL